MVAPLVALAALLVGCGGDFSQRRNQQLAEQAIWRETYQQKAAVPPVEWVHAKRLWTGAGGTTLIGWKVRVSCGIDCDWPLEATTYAHELYHWACWLRTRDVDIFHTHCDWKLVDTARDAFQHRLFDAAAPDSPSLR